MFIHLESTAALGVAFMIIKFIPAKILKKRYFVLGHFYEVALNAKEIIRCRSVLEILTEERAGAFSDEHRGLPDAIFVMMNPGSSRPLEESSSAKRIKQTKNLVPTKPDTTQYQLMRVMASRDWGHVRVLNLSDLREPKSASFAARYKAIEQAHGFKEHSIFSEGRRRELASELQRGRAAPLIFAWGVSTCLDPLINTALPKLKVAGIYDGLEKPGVPGKFLHPLPALQVAKEAWVNNLCEKLSSAA